jgi:predicted nuclease with RNAse H fold
MQTAGIDLATTESNTAVCVVNWSGGGVYVDFGDDSSDDGLNQICRDVTIDKVGIDCPFGWPAPFIAAISAHALGQRWPGRGQSDPTSFRNTLAFRLTDLKVKEQPLGAVPLAVEADRIGRTAMRCALLLDAVEFVDRSGRTGRVAEVYPAASLRRWGLHHLKPSGAEAILHQLEKLLPTMKFQPGARDRCLGSDHAFDALICAITTKAVATNQTTLPVTSEEVSRSATEGWIHVPTVGPEALVH